MSLNIIEDFVQYHEGNGILPNDTIAPSFEKALSEIKNGKKVSHWAWYIIPINKPSRTFKHKFALENEKQMKAYITNPFLYNNYIIFLTTVVEQLKEIEAIDLLNSQVDVNKLYESVSLFNKYSSNDNTLFQLTLKIRTLLSDKIYYKPKHPFMRLVNNTDIV